MKIFGSNKIRELDRITIQSEPVSSVDLMERAAGQVYDWFTDNFDRTNLVYVFAGPGNNGGDGLALARMLHTERYNVTVCYVAFSGNTSDDWKANNDRLKELRELRFITVKSPDDCPVIDKDDIVIDAIFGSGLTRSADGLAGDIIKLINNSGATVIAVDVPSGLFGEDNSSNNYETIINARHTLAFQFPRLSFMFAENQEKTGDWTVLPIGLHPAAIEETPTDFYYITGNDIAPLLRRRRKFDHKGVFGHGLLISGSSGKMGASVLAARAALRTGIGLLTCHAPICGLNVLQTSVTEAMVSVCNTPDHISGPVILSGYDAMAIGPGIGQNPETALLLEEVLKNCEKPLVIDADGLNILSGNSSLYSLLNENVILTPHPKEFERLAGKSNTGYERMIKQREFSVKYRCIVILKGAYTSVSLPDGRICFNSTGNPGMATAGSGDTLTGILLSLLAQGYSPENAALTGVYIHGKAGDIASEINGMESMIASDIIKCIGEAFRSLKTVRLR